MNFITSTCLALVFIAGAGLSAVQQTAASETEEQCLEDTAMKQPTDIEVNVEDRILKPVNEVFDAIVDPAKMSGYFISGASGPMKAGTTVEWEFADVGAKVPIDVIEVEENRTIVYEWSASSTTNRVTIRLKAEGPSTTVVTINEARFPMGHEGVKRAMGQTAGWTYFLCCLKAYVQHDINLRLGLTKRLTDS